MDLLCFVWNTHQRVLSKCRMRQNGANKPSRAVCLRVMLVATMFSCHREPCYQTVTCHNIRFEHGIWLASMFRRHGVMRCDTGATLPSDNAQWTLVWSVGAGPDQGLIGMSRCLDPLAGRSVLRQCRCTVYGHQRRLVETDRN